MDIFKALRDDHDKQRALMKILVETSGESVNRADFFKELKKELVQHAKAEERYFYAPLIEFDQTIQVTRHAIAEHHEIDELVEKLESTDMSSPVWLKTMKDLEHLVSHHLVEEEREFFQQAGKYLSEKQKVALGHSYKEEMQNTTNA